MSVVGIGTDLVEVQRIKSLLNRHPRRLPQRLLSKAELAVFASHSYPERYLAKRFAAKEAAAKALGTGIRDGIRFTDIETLNDELGKPSLRFHGAAKERFERFGAATAHLTISDEKALAIAFVVIERNT